MAIIGVVIDHCFGILYSNSYIIHASLFSTGLFVLLSGFSSYDASIGGRRISFKYQCKRIGVLYIQYAIATFVLVLYYNRFFDLKTYITDLLCFSVQAPYYFLLFFFQLKIVYPFLEAWCRICSRQQFSFIWHICTLAVTGLVSSFCICYTYVLPVHGGGQYLFGGTYLLLYYIGIVFAASGILELIKRKLKVVLCCGIFLSLTHVYLSRNGKLIIDTYFTTYLGDGSNPPGIQIIMYTIFVFLTLFACLQCLKEMEWGKRVVNFFSWYGKFTMSVFMYHLLVKDFIISTFPVIEKNIWMLRVVLFLSMLGVPVLFAVVLKRIKKFLQAYSV